MTFTDNEIVVMAKEACKTDVGFTTFTISTKHLQVFAEMVAAKAIAELESQEPVAWRIKVETKLRDGSVDVGYQLRNEKMSAYDEPLYTHPLQRTEQNFCPRCGKRTNDIHTCTPPQEKNT